MQHSEDHLLSLGAAGPDRSQLGAARSAASPAPLSLLLPCFGGERADAWGGGAALVGERKGKDGWLRSETGFSFCSGDPDRREQLERDFLGVGGACLTF